MKQKSQNWLKTGLIRVTKVHYLLILAYIVQVMAYDAAKLITPDIVLKRWYAVATLTVVVTAILYECRSKASTTTHFKALAWLLILSDIAFAAFNVYTQRGMASRAVVLFIIPVVVSAILLSRVAVFSSAVIAIAAYTTASVAYFVHYFNEGYKIELYGEILFYSSVFLVVAALLWPVIKAKKHT